MRKYKHPIITEEAQAKVKEVLQGGNLSLYREGSAGANVQALSRAFAQYFGVAYAVPMNSATACLHSALLSCGVGRGDEVIVTPYSFSASASCVLMVGAKPVFADIEDDTFCINPKEIKNKITKKTKAIIPVHLHGHPAGMDRIMELASIHSLWVIEDSSQAIGSLYKGQYTGTIGHCGVFSFNQSKPISSGEGGMLLTNNGDIARIARAVANHAEIYDSELGIIGYNYRLGEIEAILILEQLRVLEGMNDWRIMLTNYLTEGLKNFDGMTPPITKSDCKHTFFRYAVKFDEKIIGMPRDEFQDKLIEKGVYFGKGYVKPIYLLPAFGGHLGMCPVAERMWRELMVTDVCKYPATLDDMEEVLEKVGEILAGNK